MEEMLCTNVVLTHIENMLFLVMLQCVVVCAIKPCMDRDEIIWGKEHHNHISCETNAILVQHILIPLCLWSNCFVIPTQTLLVSLYGATFLPCYSFTAVC